jgi:hypothetical protein
LKLKKEFVGWFGFFIIITIIIFYYCCCAAAVLIPKDSEWTLMRRKGGRS